MALINCPECGKQISGKAEVCIGCGYPIAKHFGNVEEPKKDFEEIADEIYAKCVPNTVEAIKQLRIATGCDLKKAHDAMYLRQVGRTLEEQTKRNKEIKQQKKIQKEQERFYKNLAKCPKCKSTSISYDTKKLSLGRALVGDMIAGAPGAILGGLSSKKGYAVCLKCGKRWKI